MTARIRPMTSADRDFVVSGWSSSYRESFYAGMLSMETYAEVMHCEIGRVLAHPTTLALVAEEPGETDHAGRPFLYGFVVARQGDVSIPTVARSVVGPRRGGRRKPLPYLYYVYVKTAYRRGRERYGLSKGYAAQLFEAAGIDPARPFAYACQTAECFTLATKIPLGEFNPLPARYLETP